MAYIGREGQIFLSGVKLFSAFFNIFYKIFGLGGTSYFVTEFFWAVSESPWIMTNREMAGR
jgi:hypothetical protein